MRLSDRQSAKRAKSKFRFSQSLARVRETLGGGLQDLTKAVWSVRGAFGIALLTIAFSIANLLVAVRGKLVILPFDVYSEQGAKEDLGAGLAASLAAALNDYRDLYPARKPDEKASIAPKDNANFDVVAVFMTQLPFVNIPKSSPLNQGSIAVDEVKIGGFSLPLKRLVFENFTLLHRDVMRGALEVWKDRMRARVSVADANEVVVEVPSSEGYRSLIDHLAVELLRQQGWIEPMPMKPDALISFTQGLRDYRDFTVWGDDRKLTSAQQKYAEALKLDPASDLTRLHNATTQFTIYHDKTLSGSAEPALIRSSIDDFNLLAGGGPYQAAARIGYVAALLLYMDRAPDCNAAYQYIGRALSEVESWSAAGAKASANPVEETVLRASTFYRVENILLPSQGCSEIGSRILGSLDAKSAIPKARDSYHAALNLLPTAKISDDLKKRYELAIDLQLKYLSDDEADLLISKHEPSRDAIDDSIAAGRSLVNAKAALSDVQRRRFAPYLSGSLSQSYLRLAAVTDAAEDRMKLVDAAVAALRSELSDRAAVGWSLLRIAEIEYARNRPREAIEALTGFADMGDLESPLIVGVDQAALGFGLLLEDGPARCKVVDHLRAALKRDPSNVFVGLTAADVLRRSTALDEARSIVEQIKSTLAHSTQWQGRIPALRLALVRAKIEAAKQSSSADVKADVVPLEQAWEFPTLAADIYELAELRKDSATLTRARAVVNDSMPGVLKVIDGWRQTPAVSCALNH
jgi:hypothetical protein